MKIVITGPKGSGKTTIGKSLAKRLNIPFFETDLLIENLYFNEAKEKLNFREIYNKIGNEKFRELELKAVETISENNYCVISTGGGTFYKPESKKLLRKNSLIILLKGDNDILWERVKSDGLPSFLQGDDGLEKYINRNEKLNEAVEHLADISFSVTKTSDRYEIVDKLEEEVSNILSLNMFAPSSFGEIIRTSTFGESHGRAVGAILDGVKPGIELTEEIIQAELNKRRPGQSKVTTPRNEADQVQILSGVFEGKTTGTSICMMVFNKDQDSSKYDNLKDIFRPGHADYTFMKKYGVRDHRGGGRSSGRETIGRVASGAVAKKILADKGIKITAYTEEIDGIRGISVDYSEIEKNPVRAADRKAAIKMERAIMNAKKDHDSVGGIVKLNIENLPAGIGDPVFYKLDARLGMAFFSIGAVKGVEFGAGFRAAQLKGSENNDPMREDGFVSNNAGGILGGISSGETITAKIAVKPTPSIFQPQDSVNIDNENTEINIAGRHDPCIVPRIIPIVESMAALVILDAIEINNKLQS